MAKAKTNILIGAKVVIDYPNRWRGAKDEKTQAALRAEAEASKTSGELRGAYYFGEKATVVNYNPNEERGSCYDVLLASNGEIVSIHQAEFTVQELPNPEADSVKLLETIVELLLKIERKCGH